MRCILLCALLEILSSSVVHCSAIHSAANVPCQEGVYGIGIAQSDITGPSAGLGMMGYADFGQKTAGIHTRLRSRSFVFYDPCNKNITAFVIADLGMMFSSIKTGVLDYLAAKGLNFFRHDNLMLSATHTHSGPGGYAFYPLYNITTLGFNKVNYRAIVRGISESIIAAIKHMKAGTISYGSTELSGISYNRSMDAYENNPSQERARYDSPTNKTMHLLRFSDLNGSILGIINWFAIHPVSLTLKNNLISGDNKGLAAYLLEKEMGTTYQKHGEFIAGFAQADEGDISPYDINNPPRNRQQEFFLLTESARAQAHAAKELLESPLTRVFGPIDSRHQFVNMPTFVVDTEFTDNKDEQLCSAALGVSFAAGTENGKPDIAIFNEGTRKSVNRSSCQKEKPVLIPAGALNIAPNILPFHVLRIGQILLLGAPAELTTMTGRRIRNTVSQEFDGPIIIAGLSNEFSHYVATREEYALQHYEGASTLYGPWTSAAYQQIFRNLTQALILGIDISPGPQPPNMSRFAKSIQPDVLFDMPQVGKNFGDVVKDARDSYHVGETVRVQFVGAHLANDLRRNRSYLSVEKLVSGNFEPIYFDWDPNTLLRWKRSQIAASTITIEWTINTSDQAARYRICHTGSAKKIFTGKLKTYHGCSQAFSVHEL